MDLLNDFKVAKLYGQAVDETNATQASSNRLKIDSCLAHFKYPMIDNNLCV